LTTVNELAVDYALSTLERHRTKRDGQKQLGNSSRLAGMMIRSFYFKTGNHVHSTEAVVYNALGKQSVEVLCCFFVAGAMLPAPLPLINLCYAVFY